MAKKKVETPKGENVTRTLPFKLSDEEKARKGEATAKLAAKLEDAEAEKKLEVGKHNTKIKELAKKISNELKVINEGVERRPVKCVEVKNFEGDVVEYWFENEIRETRKMTPEDRQTEMKLAPKPKTEEPVWKRKGPKHTSKHQAPGEESREEEIASVHALETSRKGATSAVDKQP